MFPVSDCDDVSCRVRGARAAPRPAPDPRHVSVIITSGPNKRSRLEFIDPADSIEGATFWLYNDGFQGSTKPPQDLSTVPPGEDSGYDTLRISNGIQSLLSVHDGGGTGSLVLNGNLHVGVKQGDIIPGPKSVRILSEQGARLRVTAGQSADAVVSLTAGANEKAVLLLTDPTDEYFGIWPENDVGTGEPKLVVVKTGFTILDLTSTVQYGQTREGFLRNTGSGNFGGLTTAGTQKLRVVSGSDAELLLKAGAGEFQASVTLQSAGNDNAKLDLRVRTGPNEEDFLGIEVIRGGHTHRTE